MRAAVTTRGAVWAAGSGCSAARRSGGRHGLSQRARRALWFWLWYSAGTTVAGGGRHVRLEARPAAPAPRARPRGSSRPRRAASAAATGSGSSGPLTGRNQHRGHPVRGEPPPVHVAPLEHPLHVVPGLVERDQLDPVDQVIAIAAPRIAVQAHPLVHPRWARRCRPPPRAPPRRRSASAASCR